MTSDSPTTKTLHALYIINKHARKYANLGTQNYKNGKKATAKVNSVKKEALYTTKTRVLEQLQQHATKISIHTINNRDYYCFFFENENEWSFHSPITECTLLESSTIAEEKTLSDFTKTETKEHASLSLKASLIHLEKEFGVNANNHLSQEYVSYGYNSYFTGWSYLGQTSTNTTKPDSEQHSIANY